ncbi:MAG: DUF2341 domain-containing protein [Deltaproteobacteria bacterium]|nr:DUF2341 domain-containing protein [Deltaproteobacteria bacterium]
MGSILKQIVNLIGGLAIVSLAGCSAEVSGPNRAPLAVAGPDRLGLVDSRIDLNASASYDPDGDELVSYEWKIVAAPGGASTVLSDADKAEAFFTPQVVGTFIISLKVGDAGRMSEPDSLQVRVVGGCEQDSDCDDQDICTGIETCQNKICRPGTSLDCDDQNPCTDNECDPLAGCLAPVNNEDICDDSNPCTMDDICAGGVCLGVALDEDYDGYVPEGDCGGDDCDDQNAQINPGILEIGTLCEDQIDNNCNDLIDDQETVCQPCVEDEDCDDLDVCTGTETCTDNVCQPGTPIICQDDGNVCTDELCDPLTGCYFVNVSVPCEDGNECTAGDICGGGICLPGTPVQDATLCNNGNSVCCQGNCYLGECCINEDCDDQNPCTSSECFEHDCIDSFNSNLCDDGATCSSGDQCDGAGRCAGTNDDGLCPDSQICRPQCFNTLSGCGTPPTGLSLDCLPASVNLNTNPAAQCNIDLGLAGQSDCLSCRVEAGIKTLDYSDFGDDSGHCDLDGWRLIPGLPHGQYCRDAIGGCNEGGGSHDCCDELAAICTTLGTSIVLKSDKGTNCGIKKEEWRLEKVFDFTGFSDVSVCLDIAGNGANHDEGILVYAYDYSTYDRIFCLNGVPHEGINDFFYTFCTNPLGAWADDNPSVTLRIVVHSEQIGQAMYLDNIYVRGWHLGCEPGYSTLFNETFDDCDKSNWRVIGEPICTVGMLCSGDSWAMGTHWDDGGSWAIERTVDASALDSNITLCFDVGDISADDSNEYVRVEMDSGQGWEQVWYQHSRMSLYSACEHVCVNLSDINPAVNRNRALKISFTVAGDSNSQVVIDDISLSGAQHCDIGADQILLGPFTDHSDGSYDFNAQNIIDLPMPTDFICSWDSPPAGEEVEDVDSVWYRDWWNESWTRRRRLAFKNEDGTEDLLHFPLLVVLDEQRIDYPVLLPGGQDIRFIDADGTELDYEIDHWNENGRSYIWVNVPQIDSNSYVDSIFMYYGNQVALDGQDPEGVWNPDVYRAVWHLGDDFEDSSDKHNHGSNSGSNPAGGIYGGARYFDGDDYIDCGNQASLDVSGSISVEAWMNVGQFTGVHMPIVTKGNHTYGLQIQDNNRLLFFIFDSNDSWQGAVSNSNPVVARWIHVVGVFDQDLVSNNIFLYVNGSLQSDRGTVVSIPIDSYSVNIGRDAEETDRTFIGTIDEVRIAAVARSAQWVAAQFKSMTDKFIKYGQEESW